MNLFRREPVRTWLYGTLVPLVALLVGYDVLPADKAPLWLALLPAVLAVEAARSTVTPVQPRHAEERDVT